MTLIETLVSLGFKDATIVSEQKYTLVIRMSTADKGTVYERFGKKDGEAEARDWAKNKAPTP